MKYIVTADNHLRSDLPLCRTDDDWVGFQQKVLNDIVRLANEHGADIVIGGDLFDAPRVAPEIVSAFIKAILVLEGSVHIIAGNHEKAYHREANVDQSSIGILKAFSEMSKGKIKYYTCDEKNIDGRFEHSYKLNDYVTIVHTLTFPSEDEIPFACEGITPEYLLDQYDTPFIFTGDYHKNFHHNAENRHVINPGCMTIQSAKYIDYTPGVYFVDTGTKVDVTVATDPQPVYRLVKAKIEWIPILNDVSVLTANHLEEKQVRDDRIASAISVIKTGKKLTLSFIDNLKEALSKTKAPKGVAEILEEVKDEV